MGYRFVLLICNLFYEMNNLQPVTFNLWKFEPVDKKAGHIPGAVNYFWMDILEKDDDKLYLKSQNELKKQFAELMDYDEVIVYCGSGITACPNSLALSEAGIRHKLYVGSFSDWISYDENIVETK